MCWLAGTHGALPKGRFFLSVTQRDMAQLGFSVSRMPLETHAGVARAQLPLPSLSSKSASRPTPGPAASGLAAPSPVLSSSAPVLAPLASLRGVQRNRKAAEDEVSRRSRALVPPRARGRR